MRGLIRSLFIVFFLFVTNQAKAQLKTDVLVLGATASGTACAIQAARSGVSAILIEPTNHIISPQELNLNIPAFKSGIWYEWVKAHKKNNDSLKTTPQQSLEKIVKSVKNLQFLKNTNILGIIEQKNGWIVSVTKNSKIQKIKAKLLVYASDTVSQLALVRYKTLAFSNNSKINGLVNYSHNQPLNNLYRTSVAAGYGIDSSKIYAIPAGVFIPQGTNNLLAINKQAVSNSINTDDFNLALWINIGQAAGGLAAYGPFFNTAIKNANVRTLQSEMLNYKAQILPIKDVSEQDSAYKAIQQTIISSVLKLDFITGFFYPDSLVNANDVKPALCNLFTRAKLWYIDNPAQSLNLKNTVSLFSFISSRETQDIILEIKEKWKTKYGFSTSFDLQKPLTRLQFAVLINNYLHPFTIRVNFNGDFLR